MADAPKYQQIAAELRAKILNGSLPPGAKLPGERDLRTEHGVALETARSAVKVLVQEGLVEQIQGKGTFVRAFKPILRDATRRLSFEQWGAGRSIWEADLDKREMTPVDVEVATVDAPPWAAAALGTSTVVRRSRRYVVEGTPVQLAVTYVPAEIAAGTLIEQVDTGDGGVYARLAELGFTPAKFRESVRARMPSAEEAAALGLGPGRPVAEITREAATEEGHVVEVNRMVLVGDLYLLQWSFTS